MTRKAFNHGAKFMIDEYTHLGVVADLRIPGMPFKYQIQLYFDDIFNQWRGEHGAVFNNIDGELYDTANHFIPIYLLLESIIPLKDK